MKPTKMIARLPHNRLSLQMIFYKLTATPGERPIGNNQRLTIIFIEQKRYHFPTKAQKLSSKNLHKKDA